MFLHGYQRLTPLYLMLYCMVGVTRGDLQIEMNTAQPLVLTIKIFNNLRHLALCVLVLVFVKI
jgi:hypothetical protein